MKRILQVTFRYMNEELWLDLLELPEGINDTAALQYAAANDMMKEGRKSRIVQVLEQ